jgi:phage tail-like protein
MRSASQDPIETFRFDVRVISVSLAPANAINNLTNGTLSQFARVGFTSVSVPESTSTVMRYRENTDNFVMRKIPGLLDFAPIVMTRGVVADDSAKDFYRWATLVNSPNPSLSMINEITGSSRGNNLLRQSENFRKDMIIIARDREGNAARRWYIMNAWPTVYKGGTDLDAMTEEKVVESITIEYELAFELPSAFDAATEFVANLFDNEATDILGDLNLGF